MIDLACMRADAWMTSCWTVVHPKMLSAMHRGRFFLAFLVVALSVADLLLTQTILSMVEDITGDTVGEANALMAPIVMTWWAWPLRVGVPLIMVIRDLRQDNNWLMFFACTLYAAVVAWNTHMYFIVRDAI